MNAIQYDVVIVGAGAAGLTAAVALARAGFRVAAVEAAPFPGAENWSGCVYFGENLAHPDVLGPEGLDGLAWERRLVERGFFATDGDALLGMTYRDAAAFRHCYTVLRPIYDHHLAQIALQRGVALLRETTAESLIRDGRRVVGVCTNRGPVYADLVFLAEGDASHLVTREGYERVGDGRGAPKFLQGIKQVIDLPAGAVEEIFGLRAEEGAAYEMLVRNATLRGREVRLNMGGFVYTNRQGLSVGLVLPAEHLHEGFGGDPNLLMEWFLGLPALARWLRDGKRGVFGAKLIRGGGAKEIPQLIDDGLVVGGAASGVGVDFPYPNFTGPATRMGLLVAQAVRRVREETGGAPGGCTRERLERHYLEPLHKTHYWQDVEFLKRWPGYVERTSFFFGKNVDLALGSARVWTRPGRGFFGKSVDWVRHVLRAVPPEERGAVRADLRHLRRALRVDEVVRRPGIGRILLDAKLNAVRDLFGRPRPGAGAGGKVRVHYWADGEGDGRPGISDRGLGVPKFLLRWFRRMEPVLGAAARRVYVNDETPLEEKLAGVSRLLWTQVSFSDLLQAVGVGAVGFLGVALANVGGRVRGWGGLGRDRDGEGARAFGLRALSQSRSAALDMTPVVGAAGPQWEARLASLAYQTVKRSHIHLSWPRDLPEKNAVVGKGLWHVCPAHVYEARVSGAGQVQVVVNFENCIKCETCWRTSDLVDWGRDGRHRFIYPVTTPAAGPLLRAVEAVGGARAAEPYSRDPWEAAARALGEALGEASTEEGNGQETSFLSHVGVLLARLEQKLREFDEALEEEPRNVDRARAEYLQMLARYARQLGGAAEESLAAHVGVHGQAIRQLGAGLVGKAEERARRVGEGRYSWAAADGRQMRQHHLAGLRRLLEVWGRCRPARPSVGGPGPGGLRAEEGEKAVLSKLAEWAGRLDGVFAPGAWKDLERGRPLTSEQDAVLRDFVARVPVVDPEDLEGTLHPPLRKAVLAELGRRDPSLAFRAASHLWARDLAGILSGDSVVGQAGRRWARGEEWACYVDLDEGGEFVPAREARSLLLRQGDRLMVSAAEGPGVRVEPVATLGLRGAGVARVRVEDGFEPRAQQAVEGERARRIWGILSAADLVSIARGAADVLCRRAVEHATSRVQFPGLFYDEQARDAIGKFGAVKKMAAEMGAGRYLLETLEYELSPTDLSVGSWRRAAVAKGVAAEVLGTAPGSLSYNAGQIFGGTGYSEDDVLSKLYRDSAAWRFLGPVNAAVYAWRGAEVLRERVAGGGLEGKLHEEVAQRGALGAEMQCLEGMRTRFHALVGEVGATAGRSGDGGFLTEGVGRLDAYLGASEVLLLRTHARLEHGRPAECELSLLRVWLRRAGEVLDEFEIGVRGVNGAGTDRSVCATGTGTDISGSAARASKGGNGPRADAPACLTYEEYLNSPAAYEPGDFLVVRADLSAPRYVPEMVETDPALAARNRELRESFRGHFGAPRDGMMYERYIEARHRPDVSDMEFLRRSGYFRYPIPPALGGEGRKKAEYYLLTTNAQRFADFAVALTIQVNSSLGTTPVLLARDKDLPKAQKEVGPFVGDTSLRNEVGEGVRRMLGLFGGDPALIEKAYRALEERLREAFVSRTALRSLGHRFIEAWQQAGRAGKELDLAGMERRLTEAEAAWGAVCARAEEFHGELARRRRACDLFLRWVASGQVSAFALTEPSAGSDTARVATRARLRSALVEEEADGVLRFVPEGGREARYLLDADRLEFVEGVPHYRWAAGAPPARICFDEYDYETDDPGRMRYYEHGGRRVHFTDVGQVRTRDGRRWYDYWELTGAKMWITNGRVCGIMCLYAKTEEGITGFIVDRHAEGLVVGKDEEKMGQCGSPTNELSLQAVRVARENVIGLEGRGQVNALETLSVGRGGMAMAAVSQMGDLIETCRAFVDGTERNVCATQESPGGGDSRTGSRGSEGNAGAGWAGGRWRLVRMEEDRFIAQSLAYEVVGRFEHPRTKLVRTEAAAAKMLATELWHGVIETAEEILGLPGQTQDYLVEKRKRDARVMNIYEGTNEIQRFFILKDLAAEVAPRWKSTAGKEPPPAPEACVETEAAELEQLRGATRRLSEEALDLFGQGLWQNPNLQANGFILAEAVAWLKAGESTLARLVWLKRAGAAGGGGPAVSGVGVGRRAVARCFGKVRERLRRFEAELARLRAGFYAAEVRAAELLFAERPGPAGAGEAGLPVFVRPLAVLVVAEPSAGALPRPRVEGGRLAEPYVALGESERAALEAALAVRAQAAGSVRIEVAAVGPASSATVLREALSLGADRARLVVPPEGPVTVDSAAAGLAAVLNMDRFDLVLSGAGVGEDGLVGPLLAQAMQVPFAGSAARVSLLPGAKDGVVVLSGSDGRVLRTRGLPAAVAVEAGEGLRDFDVAGFLAAAGRGVEIHRWPRKVRARRVVLAGAADAGAKIGEGEPAGPLTAEEAAERLLERIGHAATRATVVGYEGVVEDVVVGDGGPGPGGSGLGAPTQRRLPVVGVLGVDREGSLGATSGAVLRAAEAVAQAAGVGVRVLLVAPPDEEAQRRAVGRVLGQGASDVFVFVLGGAVSDEVRARGLAEFWPESGRPPAVIGESWAAGAFRALALRPGAADALSLCVRRLGVEGGRVHAETSRLLGKVVARQELGLAEGGTAWVTLAEDAEVVGGGGKRGVAGPPRVRRCVVRSERFFGSGEIRELLEEVKKQTGVARLADADFILDVGFGVRNRDGYEAVVEPLARALRGLGVTSLVVGGSRKVTEELHLLPADRQIGQSGVSVNPQVLVAIGVSGAPQHLNYIGSRATIVAFNRDAEAPIMTLNQRQPRPRVLPVLGDLFETVPALTAALGREGDAEVRAGRPEERTGAVANARS